MLGCRYSGMPLCWDTAIVGCRLSGCRFTELAKLEVALREVAEVGNQCVCVVSQPRTLPNKNKQNEKKATHPLRPERSSLNSDLTAAVFIPWCVRAISYD